MIALGLNLRSLSGDNALTISAHDVGARFLGILWGLCHLRSGCVNVMLCHDLHRDVLVHVEAAHLLPGGAHSAHRLAGQEVLCKGIAQAGYGTRVASIRTGMRDTRAMVKMEACRDRL